jgi:hypothetical protein
VIEVISHSWLIASAVLDSLRPSSESELETINEQVEELPMSPDREAEQSSSPIILKSFAAMSKVKLKSSRPTSPSPSSEKSMPDSSATGDSLV